MRIQEILTTILRGGELGDKLAGAHCSLDEIDWGSGKSVDVVQPVRVGVLATQASKSGRSAFPKKSELSNPTERGRLLHFFLNHELLAIESMAYTLLRFPDAPLEFRQGVFRTLQDEQRHLQLYLTRMRDLGVDLGVAPLNLYFWKTMKSMQSPLDFVVRMSLTFEQANLDFALEYARLIEQEHGDPVTAQLLLTVHDDEVKHVAHGLKWFNLMRGSALALDVQLMSASDSEWDSYRRLLPFPLTPRRARGGRFFSADSRIQAGFSQDFVERLRIAGGSRGRVPDYFFFNPQCEIEGELTTLPKTLQTKISDLAPLMVWFTQEDDVLELPGTPSLEWQKKIFELKGELPEFVTSVEETKRFVAFDELKPWGWGRSAWKKLELIKDKTRRPPSFDARLHSDQLFSKAWWKKELSLAGMSPGWVIDGNHTYQDWKQKISNDSKNAVVKYLAKAAMGTSGRGHFILESTALPKALPEGTWVIEPYYEKVIDFSTQYELMRDGRLKTWEPRFFATDTRFQYRGSYVGNWGYHSSREAEFQVLQSSKAVLRKSHQKVVEILSQQNYCGPFGIDSMICRDPAGVLSVVPVIEVNARYTMGRVALELEAALRRHHALVQGFWFFINHRDLEKFGVGSFAEALSKFEKKFGSESVIPTTLDSSKETWTVLILNVSEYHDLMF